MPINNNQDGFTLLETLIGAFIGTLAMVFIATSMRNLERQSKRIENRLDQREAVFWLRSTIDCENIPSSCTLNTDISIPHKQGGNLIASDLSTKHARWTIRAVCSNASDGDFVIQSALLDGDGRAILDPVNKKPLDFNHPQSRIAGRTDLCSDAIIASRGSSTYQLTSPSECINSNSSTECTPTSPSDCPAGMTSAGIITDNFGHLNASYVTGTAHFRICN